MTSHDGDWHVVIAKRDALRRTPLDRRDRDNNPADEDQRSRRVERQLRHRGFEVYCPSRPESRMRRGKRVVDYRPTLGRYLLVRGRPAHKALDCDGVSHALVSEGRFATVSEAELISLRETDDKKPVARVVKDFPKGSLARVKSGLMEGYQGEVLRVDTAAEQVRVDLAIGRTWIDAVHLEVA